MSLGTSCVNIYTGEELSEYITRGQVVGGPVVGDELSGGQLT